MVDIEAIQSALRQQKLDGWLLYDFRGLNVLARRVVQLPETKMLSRRWFYFIPSSGAPAKLVHRIESWALDHLSGAATVYLPWQQLEEGVANLLRGAKKIAMEYVPRNANPYVSRVDAGTIELVRSCGVEIVSSGDLIQLFEAVWDDDQWALHQEAAALTPGAFKTAFAFIAERLRQYGSVREVEVQQRILQYFKDNKMICDHPPICAVGPHSGDPHYEPVAGKDGEIRPENFVLIDVWAKLDQPRAVYSDLTWTGFTGTSIPPKFVDVFKVVAAGRDAAINRVRDAFAHGEPLAGWQVDQAARDVIEKAGFGQYFVHRTGHSIGQEVHGNGANMDNLETREERRVLPRTCFSIEPGIYLPEFGVRSEVNVYVDKNSQVHVTGGTPQTDLVRIV